MKIALCLFCLIVLGCSPHLAEGTQLFKTGEATSLLAGETAKTRRQAPDLVTFVEVVEDSRCPAGVQCIQAGRAVVNLKVLQNGKVETRTVTVDGGHIVTDEGTLQLLRLEPYPDAAVEEPEPYHLIVSLAAKKP